MKKSKIPFIFFLILTGALITCTKKPTSIEIPYKEPIRFELFQIYLDVELPENYVKAVHEVWDNELRYDEKIKNYTWLKGDYTVFVYDHLYTFYIDSTYREVIFFTTTNPKKCTKKIYSTTTIFEAEFQDTVTILSKIKTYTYINKYAPIGNEQEAKDIMMMYLEEYIEKYKQIPYDRYLISNLKERLVDDNYIRDWVDHLVYYKWPSDFGGGIIINKLSSKLDFLGSSVFFGNGRRYFPID